MRRDRREGLGRRAARGGDHELLRLDLEIAASGNARWAFGVARIDDRFSGRKPTVDRNPPWIGWERATVTFRPTGVLKPEEVSYDVWKIPVSTLTGLAAINDRLLSLKIRARPTFILDMKSMMILNPGREPISFVLRGPDASRPLWTGLHYPWKRHFDVVCIFCQGPLDDVGLALWRRRYQTKEEPDEGEFVGTCTMPGCRRPVVFRQD